VEEETRDAYLDEVLIGGRERREIVVVDYEAAWPQRFEVERARIAVALGDGARRIEHIGSTSVPGLAAKPIVDVLVTVEDPDDESAFCSALADAGYELRVREPGHRMFRTPSRDVHVHVLPEGGTEVDRHLAFRDHLRRSPEDRARYEQLKRSLAQREWPDMNAYADAKGPLIEEILTRANGPGDAYTSADGPRDASTTPIRPARPADAAAIAGLLGELGYPTDADQARARLTRVIGRDDAGALVYELEREPVGLVTYQLVDLLYRSRGQLRITALVVRAERRRRGVARALLAAIESLARERDCFRLELTTRPGRSEALALYLAAGFCERPFRLVKTLDDQA
jgi:GrpB-like predicted nucleotidyltransferase (UPF0157 family)/ribosomal protein S18 acetylase RimI-like enzyme